MPPSRSAPLPRLTRALLVLAAAAPLTMPDRLPAQVAPVVEVVMPFDSAGRVTVITPILASRLQLTAPVWPVTEAFREARLLRREDGQHVLSVQRADGAFARYALDNAALTALSRAVNDAVARLATAAPTRSDRFTGAGTGLDVSQPAGNAFVRNQALLGLTAYGPAAAALVSGGGGAAAGGAYFLAAGTSFFVAANLTKRRTVTRAQAARAAHGGTRGALTGLGIGIMTSAEGGPEWGAPILASALGGTVAGYFQARGQSDGEAASSGLFADLAALTALGIGGATGAFEGRTVEEPFNPQQPELGTFTRTDNSLRGPGKAVLGAAAGAQILGYAIGPRYARRAAYNVTAGDVSMVFTSALLGVAGGAAAAGNDPDGPVLAATASAGLLAGAVLGDRLFARHRDRSTADGTLARIGGLAGALLGAGVAALAEAEAPGALALASVGGFLGLAAADNIIAPAKDAGPLRGVMTSARAGDDRVSLHLGPVSSLRITF